MNIIFPFLSVRTQEHDIMNHEEDMQERALKRKAHWLEHLMTFVNPGTILECGCGSGFVCEMLSSQFPDSCLIGVDISFNRLRELKEKKYPSVFPIQADISQLPLARKRFHTVLFVSSLHEVFSTYGDTGVYSVMKTIHSLLKEKGVLLIQDFLRPSPRQVTVEFKTAHARSYFTRFATEFRVRPIPYKKTPKGVTVDIGDAIEFFNTYLYLNRSPSPESWEEEMNESHYFYTKEAFQQMASECSYRVTHLSLLPAPDEYNTALSPHMHWDFTLDYQYIQLALIPSFNP